MFSVTKALFAFASCALAVQAQSSTTTTADAVLPTTGLDSCILGCMSTAAANSTCSNYTDLNCVCGNTPFQQTLTSCLLSTCTVDDWETVKSLEQKSCSSLYPSPSHSSSTKTGTNQHGPGATSTGASSATVTTGTGASASTGTNTGTGTSTSTSTSSAAVLSAPLSFGAILGAIVVSAGAIVGPAFVL